MELEMAVQFYRFGHDAALEIVHVIPASADREVSAWAIDRTDEIGVAAETHARVGRQSVIIEGLRISRRIDLGKTGVGAADINREAAAGTDDDLRGRVSVPLHLDITRDVQYSVAVDVHDLFRLQCETGHQVIVTP